MCGLLGGLRKVRINLGLEIGYLLQRYRAGQTFPHCLLDGRMVLLPEGQSCPRVPSHTPPHRMHFSWPACADGSARGGTIRGPWALVTPLCLYQWSCATCHCAGGRCGDGGRDWRAVGPHERDPSAQCRGDHERGSGAHGVAGGYAREDCEGEEPHH